ncbi:hypothetical protein [Persicobacter diffluens]
MKQIYTLIMAFGLLFGLSNCSKKNDTIIEPELLPIEGFYMLTPYIGSLNLNPIVDGQLQGTFNGIPIKEVSPVNVPMPQTFTSAVELEEGRFRVFEVELPDIHGQFRFDGFHNRLYYKLTFRGETYSSNSLNMTNGYGLGTCDHDILMDYMDEVIEELNRYNPDYQAIREDKVECMMFLSSMVASFENQIAFLHLYKACSSWVVHPVLDWLIDEFTEIMLLFRELLDTIDQWWDVHPEPFLETVKRMTSISRNMHD